MTETTPRGVPGRFVASRQDAADLALTDDVLDVLAHDRRAEALNLDVAVHGRVAHATGDVQDEAQRQLLRALLRRVAGLHAVWDLLTVGGAELCVVDVGCGGVKQTHGAIGVDRDPGPGVDVVADLERGLPFEDDSVDHVFAVHVLEHIPDLLRAMRELHRVVRPTGVLHVLTPHWRSVTAVADPTHCRLMDVQTFKYFCCPHAGVLPWRPLAATAWDATVHADLQPLPAGQPLAAERELARWF